MTRAAPAVATDRTTSTGPPAPVHPRRDMDTATQTIGMMASLTSFVIGLPHAARIVKHRDDPAELRGISFGSQVIGVGSAVLWTVYAALTAQVWVGAPHLVNGPIALATIVVLRRAREAARSDDLPTTRDVAGGHRDLARGQGPEIDDLGFSVPDDALELAAA